MMALTVPQLLVMLGAALLGVALFAPRKPTAAQLPNVAIAAVAAVAASAPNAGEPASLPAAEIIIWPTLVDPRALALDESDRRALFASLLAIDEAWCEPIIASALAEEPDLTAAVVRRDAALAARRDAA